ncbi:MAG: ATP-dependent DNA helicase RecG [Gammaproteobacteria bacterium]|nr:ATP-dependent DNA helicase RecG [Gammaproteobacteria bacterium]
MDQPLSLLRGVGPKIEEKLNKIGLHNIQDLLFHLPLRYQDRTRVVPMGSLRAGDQAVVEGSIDLAEVSFGRRRMLLCHISDGTGSLILRFFHFSNAQKESLSRGSHIRCFGEIRLGKKTLEMIHPEYQRFSELPDIADEDALTPIYSTTDGVHQLKMRDLMQQALQRLSISQFALTEYVAENILSDNNLMDINKAVQILHYPPPDVSIDLLVQGRHPAQQRLVFEELLAHYLSLRQLRQKMQKHNAHALQNNHEQWQVFLSALDFSLTNAQQRVIKEIARDIEHAIPMMRLVQGDVGSGKTIVAAAAALMAITSGHQVALMAPTEILSEQHRQNFCQWLEPMGINVVWLSGRMKVKQRREALEKIAGGEANMVIGTHALFQDEVVFSQLALVIIDEQHRFGVHQRLALREKGNGMAPHQLIMTATPIPRTLAMTAYADLDVSVIDELPPGRKPVGTVVIPESRRSEVLVRVKHACSQGSQVYWVCTLIEESESLQCQAAAESADLLQQALPDCRVGLVHGRLKAEEKEQIMNRFKAGKIDLLVATTVIEVGVDVPNASLMIVENAERLGLSQLHQLRGRVGRGAKESNCVLIYQGRLSQMAKARLAAMRETNDGFIIAQRDLELRGPGEVLGTRQTGMVQMRIADIVRDQYLMPAVSMAAEEMLTRHESKVPHLIRRWLGDNIQYGQV